MTNDNLIAMVKGWHKVYCDMAKDTPMMESYMSWSAMCRDALIEKLEEE